MTAIAVAPVAAVLAVTPAAVLIAILAAALVAVVFAITFREYGKVFRVRGKEASGFYEYFFSRCPELQKEPFSCTSGGETLSGLRLWHGSGSPAKGLITIMHGYGLNMEHYLPQAGYLARAGFQIILFDGTGVGRSTGSRILGLPQHVNDASAVLDYVLSIPGLASLPLMLYGHSSGGYAVCAVSCKKEYPIKAIVSAAAYNDALGGMKATLKRRYGIMGNVLALPLAAFLRADFGWRAAGLTAVRGLRLTGCPVLVVHSEDDPVLPFKEHFEIIRGAMAGRPNFRFLATRGENHNLGVPADINSRIWRLNKQIRQNPLAGQGLEDAPLAGQSLEDAPLAGQGLEAELWELQMALDEGLMACFLEFFEQAADGCPRPVDA